MEGISSSMPAAKNKKQLVKVDQPYIDMLLARAKESCVCDACDPPGQRTLVDVFAEIEDDPEEVEQYRADYAACVDSFNKFHAMNDDILEQYRAKGYAMVEI